MENKIKIRRKNKNIKFIIFNSDIRHYRDYHSDSMKLIRNIGFLVLRLMVIGNRVLFTLKKCRYQRVCDSYSMLKLLSLIFSFLK